MITYREDTKKVPIVKTCDKCGRIAHVYRADELVEFNSFYHFEFYGCYGSVFADGGLVEVDLCQHCLLDMIGDIWKKRVEKGKDGK